MWARRVQEEAGAEVFRRSFPPEEQEAQPGPAVAEEAPHLQPVQAEPEVLEESVEQAGH